MDTILDKVYKIVHMGKHRKTWSLSEKLEILNYEKLHGISRTCREFDISATSIYKWKKAFENKGESGLVGQQKSSIESKAMKDLARENERLKKLVAEKELTIMIQNDMLKKSR